MEKDRMFGVGKPCPVCQTPMATRGLPESSQYAGTAQCPNGNMLDHSTQSVAEAAARLVMLEAVTELGKILRDPERRTTFGRDPERPRPGLS